MGRIGTYLAMTGASAAAVLGLAACGGSSSTPSRAGSGGTITILSGTAPQSADSQADLSSQGTQLISVVNTPLLVFRRAPGDAGSKLRPGLARSMPEVSNGGRTYVLRLRAGLHYSDGTPIRAGDFRYAVKRAIRRYRKRSAGADELRRDRDCCGSGDGAKTAQVKGRDGGAV